MESLGVDILRGLLRGQDTDPNHGLPTLLAVV